MLRLGLQDLLLVVPVLLLVVPVLLRGECDARRDQLGVSTTSMPIRFFIVASSIFCSTFPAQRSGQRILRGFHRQHAAVLWVPRQR